MNYQEIEGKNCTVTLENRPPHCDRGRFIAKIFLKPGKTVMDLHIDGADAWPRYYFFESHAKLEVEQWLRFRGELVTHDWNNKTA